MFWKVWFPLIAAALVLWVAWPYLSLLLCKAWADKDCPFCNGRGYWQGNKVDGTLDLFRCECTDRK